MRIPTPYTQRPTTLSRAFARVRSPLGQRVRVPAPYTLLTSYRHTSLYASHHSRLSEEVKVIVNGMPHESGHLLTKPDSQRTSSSSHGGLSLGRRASISSANGAVSAKRRSSIGLINRNLGDRYGASDREEAVAELHEKQLKVRRASCVVHRVSCVVRRASCVVRRAPVVLHSATGSPSTPHLESLIVRL